jgi:hypothetical protein
MRVLETSQFFGREIRLLGRCFRRSCRLRFARPSSDSIRQVLVLWQPLTVCKCVGKPLSGERPQ